MEVNETRKYLVTDIFLKIGWQILPFKNGKTQLFNSGRVVKWAYFQKKWSIPLSSTLLEEKVL